LPHLRKEGEGFDKLSPNVNGWSVSLTPTISPVPQVEAPRDCPLCPRLGAYREELRAEHPDWWNAPVPNFGDPHAWLGICGLAPGKHGANRTGRPFTGDFAGLLLYRTLLKFGLASGEYEERPDDTLRLDGVAIVNSVKCVPPQNKPTPEEISNCRAYFLPSLAALPNVRVLVALGQIAHVSAVRAAGGRQADHKFGHLAEHRLPDGRILIDSYHCSRYNQNTNRLTALMFEQVFARALELRASPCPPEGP
jgi:uracil-DNA glycosylase family 4